MSAICGITLAAEGKGEIFVRDAAEDTPPPPRARVVELSRGEQLSIIRKGARHVAVTYEDAMSDGALAAALCAMSGPEDPIAGDPESLAVFALAQRIAASDIPVLINGPTGTGKEVLSRFVHSRSPRADKPFIAVNCAAMPETMLEAMLFGYQKGAFTGANAASEGFIRAADGGSLLLDEISEMPLALQAKLLRALQEQEVVPIGASVPVKVDVRIIAAANRDLSREVAEGRFRQDLYYRLNVFPLGLEALEHRPQDIALLAQAMVMRHSPAIGPVPCIADSAIAMLKDHDWPGNVRELENVIRRALLLADGAPSIGANHIMFDRAPARALFREEPRETARVIPLKTVRHEPAAREEACLSSVKQESEMRAILEALEECGGNRLRTADRLGISERTLRYRLASMREAGVEIERRASGGVQCRR
ncbi:MAG: sigma-54-dependent Fis family transcriptional regulator [Croceicoccus sp.]|nr:sigma-54-dependent Fis family transcriptional regulator [Croceicoccus sp.]|tara:strand:+ start:35599 stop:36867 length:1269 start_codon:yes stop_codon:yes gene_type:complete